MYKLIVRDDDESLSTSQAYVLFLSWTVRVPAVIVLAYEPRELHPENSRKSLIMNCVFESMDARA